MGGCSRLDFCLLIYLFFAMVLFFWTVYVGDWLYDFTRGVAGCARSMAERKMDTCAGPLRVHLATTRMILLRWWIWEGMDNNSNKNTLSLPFIPW